MTRPRKPPPQEPMTPEQRAARLAKLRAKPRMTAEAQFQRYRRKHDERPTPGHIQAGAPGLGKRR